MSKKIIIIVAVGLLAVFAFQLGTTTGEALSAMLSPATIKLVFVLGAVIAVALGVRIARRFFSSDRRDNSRDPDGGTT